MTGFLRSRDAGYTLLAAVLPLLLLLPALVQPSRLLYPSWSTYSDLTLIHWPKVVLLRDSSGPGIRLPLWSPYGLSGQPLAANQLAMLFYPPALLLLAGPLAWSFSLFFALHLAWASIGTYWLVRGLDRQPESALLAAIIFALGGKLAAHLAVGHASLVAALAWTPWAFAFLHLALKRRSTLFAILTGVALAAQLTTHTYALVYTAYGLMLYSLLYLILSPGTVADRLRAGLSSRTPPGLGPAGRRPPGKRPAPAFVGDGASQQPRTHTGRGHIVLPLSGSDADRHSIPHAQCRPRVDHLSRLADPGPRGRRLAGPERAPSHHLCLPFGLGRDPCPGRPHLSLSTGVRVCAGPALDAHPGPPLVLCYPGTGRPGRLWLRSVADGLAPLEPAPHPAGPRRRHRILRGHEPGRDFRTGTDGPGGLGPGASLVR